MSNFFVTSEPYGLSCVMAASCTEHCTDQIGCIDITLCCYTRDCEIRLKEASHFCFRCNFTPMPLFSFPRHLNGSLYNSAAHCALCNVT